MKTHRGRQKMRDDDGDFIKAPAIRFSKSMLRELNVIAALEGKHRNDIVREFLHVGITQYNRRDESESQTI